MLNWNDRSNVPSIKFLENLRSGSIIVPPLPLVIFPVLNCFKMGTRQKRPSFFSRTSLFLQMTDPLVVVAESRR